MAAYEPDGPPPVATDLEIDVRVGIGFAFVHTGAHFDAGAFVDTGAHVYAGTHDSTLVHGIGFRPAMGVHVASRFGRIGTCDAIDAIDAILRPFGVRALDAIVGVVAGAPNVSTRGRSRSEDRASHQPGIR